MPVAFSLSYPETQRKSNASDLEHGIISTNASFRTSWSDMGNRFAGARSIMDLRLALAALLKSKATETSLALVILTNLVLLVYETDCSSTKGSIEDPVQDKPPQWVASFNTALLTIYTVELVTRLFVYRCQFFLDGWCIMDFLIVGSDFFFIILDVLIGNMPKVAVLRCFRLVRVVRAFKALSKFPELDALMRGFVSAFTAIFWGLVMIMFLLVVWSILAVQLLHPANRRVTENGLYEGCERCPRAFETVWNSVCTFTQTLLAGDSWGLVAMPIIDEEPLSFALFMAVLVTVSLAVMNLILAVIVDSGQQARHDALNEKHAMHDATKLFRSACVDMDTNKNGHLSEDEIDKGFQDFPEFRSAMNTLGVRRQDVHILVDAFDKEGIGEIEYGEFVDETEFLTDLEPRQLLVIVKLQMDALIKEIEKLKANTRETSAHAPPTPQSPEKEFAAPEPSLPKEKLPGDVDDMAQLTTVNEDFARVMKDMLEQSKANAKILLDLHTTIKHCKSDTVAPLQTIHLKEAKTTTSPVAASIAPRSDLGLLGSERIPVISPQQTHRGSRSCGPNSSRSTL